MWNTSECPCCKSGVIGRVAAAAAEAAGEAKEFEDVTPNAVRLFKYLVPDYYEDFKLSTAAWVHEHVEVICQPQAECQPQAAHQSETQSETQPQAACQALGHNCPQSGLVICLVDFFYLNRK